MKKDEIEIRKLEVETFIGVPYEERASAQKLWVSVRMFSSQGFVGLADNISNTIDYYQVSLRIAELAASRPRHLIETLATEIADFLLGNFALASVDVEIEKRILPNAECVAVRIHRDAF